MKTKMQIRNLIVKTKLDKICKKGELYINFDIEGDEKATIRAFLSDEQENKIDFVYEQPVQKSMQLQMKIADVNVWSAETPNLYLIVIELVDINGKIIEWFPQRIGFSRYELIENQLCINGNRAFFRGINRNYDKMSEETPYTREDLIADIKQLKQNNINAVRIYGEKCPDYLFELCNIYGLYVIVEDGIAAQESDIPGNGKYPCILKWEYNKLYHLKPEDIIAYLEENREEPCISSEFMYAEGNSLGGMKEFLEIENKYKHYQGGFLWDFGVRSVLTEPAKAQEIKAVYSNIGVVVEKTGIFIENKNLFLSTAGYEIVYFVEKEGFRVFVEKEKINLPSHFNMFLPLSFPEIRDPGEYTFNVSFRLIKDCLWARKGHEVAFGQYVMTVPNISAASLKEKSRKPFKVVHMGDRIEVSGEDFAAAFSKEEGGLTSLSFEGVEYITSVPAISFWRAMTNNDKRAEFAHTVAQWQIAGQLQKQIADGFMAEETEEEITLHYVYQTPTVPSFQNKIKYRMTSEGRLYITLDYPGVEGMPIMPLFGMDFKVKSGLSSYVYYGNGPQENYIDRKEGVRLGVFNNSGDKNMSNYTMPQECGNRTGIRWMELIGSHGKGIHFQCEGEPFEGSVLPYSAYDLGRAASKGELPRKNYTWVRIIAKQMGVGSGGYEGLPVYNQFTIAPEDPILFTFSISKIVL